MTNTLSKINLSKIGWEGGREVNINSDNVLKYTVFVFFRVPLSRLLGTQNHWLELTIKIGDNLGLDLRRTQ